MTVAYFLPFAPDAKIIELGGGAAPRFRPNVDARWGPTTDFTADFEEPLPIQSESNLRNGTACSLSEVHRILKPAGVAVFVTANAPKLK